MLVGAVHHLLTCSTTDEDLSDAGALLKLFVAQSETLFG